VLPEISDVRKKGEDASAAVWTKLVACRRALSLLRGHLGAAAN
jgi:hypothetical protein